MKKFPGDYMGDYIKPPKFLTWSKTFEQTHWTSKHTLVTGGASFIVGTNQLSHAESWPGYLYERCNFDRVIDMSFPGIGNPEMKKLVLSQLDTMPPNERNSTMVVVMWNAHDVRGDINWQQQDTLPEVTKADSKALAKITYEVVCSLSDFLIKNRIPYAFTFAFNVLCPPFIHRRDQNLNLGDYLKDKSISEIKKRNFFPLERENFLYDFTFYNDMFDSCMYHPNIHCRLKWTDEILLPNLERLHLVKKINTMEV